MRAIIWLLVLVSVTLGCHDATSGPLVPVQPTQSIGEQATYTEVSVAPILMARDINDKGVVVGQLTPFPAGRAGVRYPDGRVVNLGVLPGDDWSDVAAINNKGQVVGSSGSSATGLVRAYIWEASRGMRPLGSLAGDNAQAYDINDRGIVVGSSYRNFSSYFKSTAFLWDATNGMINLGLIFGDTLGSSARAINYQGDVVGWSTGGAFRWHREKGMRVLPLPQGTSPQGINRTGMIVGTYWNAAMNRNEAFRWTELRGLVSLGPSVGTYGGATAVGDNGSVAGVWLIGGVPRAFVGRGELPFSAGDQSAAQGINNCGVAVGWSNNAAVLWVPSGVSLTGVCPP